MELISLNERSRWDKLVESFSMHDIYYLSGYAKAFHLHGDGMPLLLYYEDKKLRGINVVMKRDIATCQYFKNSLPSNTFFDLSTPYGYGGFIFDGECSPDAMDSFNKRYTGYCKQHNLISEFVRFHPLFRNHCGFQQVYDIEPRGHTVVVELISERHLWENFSSNNRNMVRKAQKQGVEISTGSLSSMLLPFKQNYDAAMESIKADKYYFFDELFYKAISEDLSEKHLVFFALYEGEIIAAALILLHNQFMHYHLSAVNRTCQKLAPTNLLLYEVAKWGLERGYKKLHLGGGVGGRNDSLFKFKQGFNKNSQEAFFIGKKCFNKQAYDWLLSLRQSEPGEWKDSSFYPLYRA